MAPNASATCDKKDVSRYLNVVMATFILSIGQSLPVSAATYAKQIEQLSQSLAKPLAASKRPSGNGAIGRNKAGYFHARFQLGIHHLADFGLAARRVDALEHFVSAAEYAFDQQLGDGGFALVIPATLESEGSPSAGDLASGAAFFAASLGAGLLALQTSDWFAESNKCESLRSRISALRPNLEQLLAYLQRYEDVLLSVDRLAPNRLLFDAMAFQTLGELTDNTSAAVIARRFHHLALVQIHAEGYFIEAGGFDSSYNGVAAALVCRLALMRPDDLESHHACRESVAWQLTRITVDGAIATEGNTRVTSAASGESFLGRKKDVDVGRTIEALMLAAQVTDQVALVATATRVLEYYQSQR